MTKKVVKWYAKMNFWQFVGYVVAPLTIAGEGAIVGLDLHPAMHIGVFMAVIASGFVKFIAKDEDNNGIVDFLDKK